MPDAVRVDFLYAGGRYEGAAVVEAWHESRGTVRVRPEGWSHGIWIGADEIVGR